MRLVYGRYLKWLGAIENHDHPWEDNYRELLKSFNADFPHLVKVLFRHIVEPQYQFRMKTGYANFQPIQKGEHLSDSVDGPVHAPIGGLIFMPLDQQDGNDGFFIVSKA